ncbi:MAG: hypothetical protein LBQ46_05480 [Treponema sp.]|jgi:hypothetical protein|nr:hypothetical protein [Treponema sp.]
MKKVCCSTAAGALVALAVLASCASAPASSAASGPQAAPQQSAREAAIEAARPIRTAPAVRPDWIDIVPKSGTELSFVGASLRFATDAQARNNAQEDGRRQLVDYYGTLMANKAREYTATAGISGEVFSPQIAAQQLNERIAQNVAQALGAAQFYTEVYLDSANREAYQVYVLMEIARSRVAQVIDDYGREQAADYAKRAAAEQDAARKQQLEKTAEFFGGNLSGALDL